MTNAERMEEIRAIEANIKPGDRTPYGEVSNIAISFAVDGTRSTVIEYVGKGITPISEFEITSLLNRIEKLEQVAEFRREQKQLVAADAVLNRARIVVNLYLDDGGSAHCICPDSLPLEKCDVCKLRDEVATFDAATGEFLALFIARSRPSRSPTTDYPGLCSGVECDAREMARQLIDARKQAAYSKEYVEETDGVIERLAEKVEALEEQLAAVRKLLDNVGPDSTPEVCAQLARWCADYDT